MKEPQQSLEEALFELAVQKPTTAERVAFLDGVCRDNPALRARLDVLLEGHFGGAGFLAQATEREAKSVPAPPTAASTAPMIGRYKLLEKIGEGGFGEVWMAEQREPVKRRVALKIIKLGMDSRQVVARFEAERQALAMMDHPNIAKILDAGATGSPQSEISNPQSEIPVGRPYFVMELVRGTRITEYCDKNSLPTPERLKLFILVCQAIQHAHQKGIIHRDIKPSNILVTLHDGVPVPKVIDFGIAKATQGELTDKTVFTQFQQFIGTPAYISPEQAEMSGLDIDTRADIYSLGVLLYELLVGQTPFDAKEMMNGGLDGLRQTIREKEPLKPSTKLKTLSAVELTTTAQRRQTDAVKLTHLMRGDLDWIVMKCLEKDRAHRYETANTLAMDIQRYLASEPVLARPPSTAYRVRKLIRRNKLAFTAAAFVTLALVLGVNAVIFVQHRANQDYRRRLYVSEVNRAGLAWQAGRGAEMRVLLDRCPPDLRHWEWQFLHQQLDRWEQKVLLTVSNLTSAQISEEGHLLAVATRDTVQIRDYPSGRWLRNIPFAAAWQSPFMLSPQGDFMATLGGDAGALTVWNMRTGERVLELKHGSAAGALTWFNSGKILATGGADRTIRIWNMETGREERHFSIEARIFGLGISPDDQTLAVGTSGTEIHLLDATTGALKRTFRSQGPFNSVLQFSPDGRELAVANATAGGFKSDKRVWSLEDGGSLDLRSGAEGVAYAFAADGRQLAIADAGGSIKIWDLERRVEVERFSAHAGETVSVRWLPDDRILSAGTDGAIRIWQARRPGVVQLKGYPNSLRTIAFSPDSRLLALAGLAQGVHLWETAGAQRAGIYRNNFRDTAAVAFGPDGRAASASADHMVHVWNPATLETVWAQSLEPASAAWWIAWSPDARRLYASSFREKLTVLDADTGKLLNSITLPDAEHSVDGLAVSPDGRLLALCQKVRLIILRAQDLQELWQAPANPDRCAAFSPDGQWIATGDRDGAVSLWEVASEGRVRRTLRGHAASVSGVGFHPDGSRLVSCSLDGQVKVWDWRAGVELLTLLAPGGGILWHALFSPNGKMIAAAGGDGVVSLWKVE